MRSALLAIVLWATFAALAVRLKDVPPFLLVGLALLIGSLCSVHRIREWKVRPKVLFVGIYGMLGFHLFIFLAFRLAPSIEVNLLNYLWPLLIILLSPLFLAGYRLTVLHVLAALIGFSGAALAVTGGHFHFVPANMLGYACAVAAAFFWATYSLLTKRMGSFPTSAVGLFCLVAGVAALGCHFAFEPRYSIALDQLPFLVLIGLGPMGAAFFFWDHALKNADARAVGSLAFLIPILSTLLLMVCGQGRLSASSAAALLLIVGGAMLGVWAGKAPYLIELWRRKSGRCPR